MAAQQVMAVGKCLPEGEVGTGVEELEAFLHPSGCK